MPRQAAYAPKGTLAPWARVKGKLRLVTKYPEEVKDAQAVVDAVGIAGEPRFCVVYIVGDVDGPDLVDPMDVQGR